VLLKLYCSLEPLSEKAMEPKASQAKVVSTAAKATTRSHVHTLTYYVHIYIRTHLSIRQLSFPNTQCSDVTSINSSIVIIIMFIIASQLPQKQKQRNSRCLCAISKERERKSVCVCGGEYVCEKVHLCVLANGK